MQADANRRAELARIHIAKKQLGLDDDLYRAIIARVSAKFRREPVASSAKLEPRERVAVLAEFERLGFKPTPPGGDRRDWIDVKDDRHSRKLIALFDEACKRGIFRAKSRRAALRKFLRRQTGRDAIQWLGPTECNKVIEALKTMIAREAAKAPAEAAEQR